MAGGPMNSGERALEFVHAGQESNAASGLVAAYSRLLQDFGVAYHCAGELAAEKTAPEKTVPGKTTDVAGSLWAASSQHRWFHHWKARRYVRVDPLVWYMRKHQNFVRWSRVRQMSDCPRTAMFDEAAEFGLRDGVSFAVSL